jgi:hypothetical protein
MSKIPERAAKISGDRLSKLNFFHWSRGSISTDQLQFLLVHKEHGFDYEFLIDLKPNTERLYIIFSGDAVREKNEPPVFQRWSWSKIFPGSCIYISDPSLRLNSSLGLAWYVGTSEIDHFLVISEIVRDFLVTFGLSENNTCSYGSSGGGFAALRLLNYLPASNAIAINPQTDILSYHEKQVRKFLDVCFHGIDRDRAKSEYGERLNIINNLNLNAGQTALVVQNVFDNFHLKNHFLPLLKSVEGTSSGSNVGKLRGLTFSNTEGHRAAEGLELCKEILQISLSLK